MKRYYTYCISMVTCARIKIPKYLVEENEIKALRVGLIASEIFVSFSKENMFEKAEHTSGHHQYSVVKRKINLRPLA